MSHDPKVNELLAERNQCLKAANEQRVGSDEWCRWQDRASAIVKQLLDYFQDRTNRILDGFLTEWVWTQYTLTDYAFVVKNSQSYDGDEVGRFRTAAEAQACIVGARYHDPGGVEQGVYVIDGPEVRNRM